jgi:type II secretory pathway pseudopilin PulG
VIGIISILAAMVFPITGAVNRQKMKTVATTLLTQVETALEDYKSKRGHYPPDNALNPRNPAFNQLYYELIGTTVNGTSFTTKDGSDTIAQGAVSTLFGTQGFVNSGPAVASDEGTPVQNFLKNLKANQFLRVTNGGAPCTVLGSTVLDGPILYGNVSGVVINPIRYVSSSPSNNPKTYDLWIDYKVGGKTNRVCNWTTQVLTP